MQEFPMPESTIRSSAAWRSDDGLARMPRPKLTHRKVGVGCRPSNEQQPVEHFDTGQQSEMTAWQNIPEAERGVRDERKIRIVEML